MTRTHAGPKRRGGALRTLRERLAEVRAWSARLAAPLAPEDMVVQSMADASPTRWHLAHTTWFFETFVLREHAEGYRPLDEQYKDLFNSYYNAVGIPFPRPRRGALSRPTVAKVLAYRAHVDAALDALLSTFDPDADPDLAQVIELGIQHEQQHQELMLTDIKHAFASNPLLPGYRQAHPGDADAGASPAAPAGAPGWASFAEGLRWIGHDGAGFAYDNESPRHREFVPEFELATRLVTCGEFEAFIADGGYRRSELWLADGWDWVCREGIEAPMYWFERDGAAMIFTLVGPRPRRAAEPVCHVSFFEADAYARWAGCRLPTEAEWETAAAGEPVEGNLLDSGRLHPSAARSGVRGGLMQLFGDVWEWTASQYRPYPGYRPPAGALGEYNGKFMCNQFVLRGGSCATPGGHIRASYRNFFQPEKRWQFTGFRLAR